MSTRVKQRADVEPCRKCDPYRDSSAFKGCSYGDDTVDRPTVNRRVTKSPWLRARKSDDETRGRS